MYTNGRQCATTKEVPWSIVTARVRSTREGNVLIRVCVCVHMRGGTPAKSEMDVPPSAQWRVPHPVDAGGGTPIWPIGVPHPAGWGVPLSGQQGGTPSTLLGRYLYLANGGYPHPS